MSGWLRVDDALVRPATSPVLSPGAARLIDCDVCAGLGLMTARAVGDLDGPGTPVPCPNCDGVGVFLRPTENVVTDLADWAAEHVERRAPRSSGNRQAARWRRLAAGARGQARCCIVSAVAASTAADVEAQCQLGLRFLRAAASYDAVAFAIELGGVLPRPASASAR